MSKPAASKASPDWEQVLSSAARLQRLLPEAVLAGESALQQMLVQLSSPKPYDLDGTILSEYNSLESRWHDWDGVRAICARAATVIFDRRCDLDEPAIPNA